MINVTVTLCLKSSSRTSIRLQVDVMLRDSILLIYHATTKGVYELILGHPFQSALHNAGIAQMRLFGQ